MHEGFVKWSIEFSRVTRHSQIVTHTLEYITLWTLPCCSDCGYKVTVTSKVVMVGVVTDVPGSTLHGVYPDRVGGATMVERIQQFPNHLRHSYTINIVQQKNFWRPTHSMGT